MDINQEQQAVKDITEKNKASIPGWKEKHLTVKAVAFTTKNQGVHAFIIASPTQSVVDAYKQYDHEGKVKKVDDLFIGNCILAGDTKILDTEPALRQSVLNSITNLVTSYQASEKEL